MRKFFNAFARDERGATILEYAILCGLIALVAVVGVTAFGEQLSTTFTNLATSVGALPTAVPGGGT